MRWISSGDKGLARRPLGPPQQSPDRVVVLNDFSVVRGGATSVALASLHVLHDRGVSVTLIAGDQTAGNPEVVPAERIGIGSRHILAVSPGTAAVQGLYNGNAESVVSKWISAHDTPGTVYHLHGWSKILSPSVFRALRPVAPRLIINAHDFFLVCPNGGYFNFRRSEPCKLEPMGLQCLFTSCDRRSYTHKLWRCARHSLRTALFDLRAAGAILAVHDGMVPHLVKGGVPRERLRVIRNPVMPWRRARVTAECNRTFVFIGRLEEDKGVDLLARAARRARVPLRMIGDGPLRGALSREYSEIEHLGWRSRAEIADAVADARLLVIPSRTRETFGVAALEGLMSGLPVALSAYAMIAEEVERCGFGVSFDPCEQEAFASMLARLSGDDESVANMSRRAYTGARRLAPTPAEWGERLLAMYAEVLSRDHRGEAEDQEYL
jgi:glycosyltransferase involved in cell wall biosynthesis